MPVRLIAPMKYSFATALAGCSSFHRYDERPRDVADGLKTIFAPARPSARQLREVPVVTDVDADPADRGVEDRVTEVSGTEVELLPEALHLGNVVLSVFTEVTAVGVDHGGGVVEDAGLLLLVHRQDHDDAEFLGQGLETLGGRAGDRLRVGVELGVLHLAEVRAVEQLLETDDLGAWLPPAWRTPHGP